jgi:hypothetical protein
MDSRIVALPQPQVSLERQATLGLTLPKAVAVIGCGGVGSWLSYFLALAGVPELWLFDHDTVSPTNLNRLPVPPSCVGQHKAEALTASILAMRPTCTITPMGAWTTAVADGIKLAEKVDWVAVTTDTHANRLAVHKWCADKVRYVEASAEGEFGGATGAPAEWSTELERAPGYASVPVWVGPCVTSAWLACSHILHNKPPIGANYRLGWSEGAPVWQVHIDAPPATKPEVKSEPTK